MIDYPYNFSRQSSGVAPIRIFATPLPRLVALSALAGILGATSYIPFPPWAIFFCFVPLWIVWLGEKSWQQICLAGWVAQFVSNLIAFNWVAPAAHQLVDWPWPLVILGFLGFCLFNNAFLPVVGVVWFAVSERLKLSSAAKIWLLPILMDIGQRIAPALFPWNFGYPWLWARLPGFQLADLIGFQGLSTMTLVLNTFVLLAWWRWRRRRSWMPALAAGIALFGLLNLLGAWHAPAASKDDAELKFLVVQPDIDYRAPYAQHERDPFDIIVSQLADVTRQGLDTYGKADFVVWPENAFPAKISATLSNDPQQAWLKTFIIDNRTPLITGGASWAASKKEATNSLFVFGADGQLLAPRYDKTVLIAFGEYVPFAGVLPWLSRLLPTKYPIDRGTDLTVLHAGTVNFGAQICYEGLFDWFSRKLANEGAQILLNVANDSLFPAAQEPYQHGFETLARAIEVRRPLVRVANSGLSMVMLAGGELLTVSPQDQPWSHLYTVPYAKNPPVTVFMSWGYWLVPLMLVASLLIILLAGQQRFPAPRSAAAAARRR